MISRLVVDNFKALRHVDVDLGRFTVLICPTDSGKSSFLEALHALGESTRRELSQCFFSPWQDRELVYQHGNEVPVRFTAELTGPVPPRLQSPEPGAAVRYELALAFGPGRNCNLAEERISSVGNQTDGAVGGQGGGTTSLYHYNLAPPATPGTFNLRAAASGWLHPPALARWDVEELSTPSRLPPSRPYPFDESGYGLATCIAEMKLDDERRFQALRDDFRRLFPEFREIKIRRANVREMERDGAFQKSRGGTGEGYALVLLRNDGVEMPAGLASGGTLVTLAYLTLAHSPSERKLLLVEEPENGLHPQRVGEVVRVLREAVASQEDGQVIITTHSPLLLDFVQPEEARIFLRNEQQDVEVFNVADVPDIQERLKFLMLGELVCNEGEQELVAEIRQHAGAGRR
jgi:predicted ATPase